LGLRQFKARSGSLLRLSVMTKLLFCVLVYRFCQALELLGDARRQISLLRRARILGQWACWFAVAVLELTPVRWLEHQLAQHVFYERRHDRQNHVQLLAELNAGLVVYFINTRTFVASHLSQGEARRRSVAASTTQLRSNKAPAQMRRNPPGGSSFRPSLRCSLLTDRWRVCSFIAPRLGRKSHAANVCVFMK
jgi:hypothetical protein